MNNDTIPCLHTYDESGSSTEEVVMELENGRIIKLTGYLWESESGSRTRTFSELQWAVRDCIRRAEYVQILKAREKEDKVSAPSHEAD